MPGPLSWPTNRKVIARHSKLIKQSSRLFNSILFKVTNVTKSRNIIEPNWANMTNSSTTLVYKPLWLQWDLYLQMSSRNYSCRTFLVAPCARHNDCTFPVPIHFRPDLMSDSFSPWKFLVEREFMENHISSLLEWKTLSRALRVVVVVQVEERRDSGFESWHKLAFFKWSYSNLAGLGALSKDLGVDCWISSIFFPVVFI